MRTSSQRWETLQLKGHEWRDVERFLEAFGRPLDIFPATGSPTTTYAMKFTSRERQKPPLRRLESWALWLAKPDKKRAQFHVGGDVATAVFIGDRWRSWSPTGYLTNEGTLDSTHGLGPGEALIDPRRHLTSLRFQFVDERTFLSRSALLVTAYPNPQAVADQDDFGVTFHLLGAGADLYRLLIDGETGLLLRSEAQLKGQVFRIIEIDEIAVNQPLSDATFDHDRLSAGIVDL